MKPKTFIIRSKDVIFRLLEFVEQHCEESLIEVIVRDHKKDRTLAQNRLMWDWITLIAKEQGNTKEDVHYDFKKRLLVPIFERDSESYAAMIQAVRKVHTQGFRVEAKAMGEEIVRLTSTTSASVAQFTEYLNDIEKDAINQNIRLPHPEDRYNYAMGIK